PRRRPALLPRPDPGPWSRVASHVASQAPNTPHRTASAARLARAPGSRAMRVHLFRHRFQLAAERTNSGAPRCLPGSCGLAVRRPITRCRVRDARASAPLRREFSPGLAVVPTLWHLELGNVLLAAERRGRTIQGGIVVRLSLR